MGWDWSIWGLEWEEDGNPVWGDDPFLWNLWGIAATLRVSQVNVTADV